jgi:hypothetical protein
MIDYHRPVERLLHRAGDPAQSKHRTPYEYTHKAKEVGGDSRAGKDEITQNTEATGTSMKRDVPLDTRCGQAVIAHPQQEKS